MGYYVFFFPNGGAVLKHLAQLVEKRFNEDELDWTLGQADFNVRRYRCESLTQPLPFDFGELVLWHCALGRLTDSPLADD